MARMDADVRLMGAARLRREVMRLRSKIRSHRSTRDNARCWIKDQELYHLLPERPKSRPISLPDAEFLVNCKRYLARQRRQERRGARRGACPLFPQLPPNERRG